MTFYKLTKSYRKGVIDCSPTLTHNHHYNSIQGRVELLLLFIGMEVGLVSKSYVGIPALESHTY